MAVTEAIEKAVESLVIEGLKDGLWESTSSPEEIQKAIASYDEDKKEAEERQIYNRLFQDRRSKNAFELSAGGTLFDGDYPNPKLELMPINIGYKRFLNSYINLGLNYAKFNLANKELHNYKSTYGFMSFDLKSELFILPYDDFSPYIYVGAGLNASNYFKQMDPKTEFGVGFEYLMSKKMGVKIYGGQSQVFSDELDGIVSGKRDDFYWKFGLGVNYYFSKNKKKKSDGELSIKEQRLKRKLERRSLKEMQ